MDFYLTHVIVMGIQFVPIPHEVSIYENFIHFFLGKFRATFKRISRNFKKNFKHF